jgi:hypothetical protein
VFIAQQSDLAPFQRREELGVFHPGARRDRSADISARGENPDDLGTFDGGMTGPTTAAATASPSGATIATACSAPPAPHPEPRARSRRTMTCLLDRV